MGADRREGAEFSYLDFLMFFLGRHGQEVEPNSVQTLRTDPVEQSPYILTLRRSSL